MNREIPDKLIRLADVPKLPWLPERPGATKVVTVKTVYTWSTRGVRGVVLRTVGVGGTRCTCEAWVMEFFERLSIRGATNETVTPSQQAKAHRRAQELLVKYGIRDRDGHNAARSHKADKRQATPARA